MWITGLSGAGKTTLAHSLERHLFDMGCQVAVLDGDNLRRGLCADLNFSDEDRSENVRRVGEVAKLFAERGFIVITALISPFRTDRGRVRAMFSSGDFIEVFVDCPLAICEERDVKGLYKTARAGAIAGFTGVSAPYEKPEEPELVVKSAITSVADGVSAVSECLARTGVIATAGPRNIGQRFPSPG